MTSCDEQDFLVVSALGEVETAGTLSVGCGLGSNEEPKRGSKRTANIDGRMYVGNGFEEAWTGRLDVDGLPALDVDVVDSELEKGQAAVHRRCRRPCRRESRERHQFKARRNRRPPRLRS